MFSVSLVARRMKKKKKVQKYQDNQDKQDRRSTHSEKSVLLLEKVSRHARLCVSTRV